MDKQIVESHRKGLKTAEQLFLQDPQFDIRSDHEIVKRIKKVHAGLMDKILHQHPEASINPGVFRTKEVSIFDDTMLDRSAEGFVKYLKSHGGTKADEVNLKSWIKKLQQHGEEKAGKYHTPEEIEAVKKVLYFPLNSAKVPEAMDGFAKKLKEIYSLVKNRLVHPIAAASWTHQECGHIHAFADGNGRECRTLTNAVLSWGGIKGIVFPSDKEYTAAIKADQKVVGTFARYLLNVIGWNAKQKALSASSM